MRRISSIGAGLALAVALGRVVPGCGASSFVCESDESCAGLAEGQCEADGRCSIPDDDCSSGRRYAAHSGELSGHCVGDEATGTSTTEGGATEIEPTSADEGSSGPPPATTGTSTAGETGELPLEVCEQQVIVSEPFDGLPIDTSRWDVSNDEGIAFNVLGGELRLAANAATVAYGDLTNAFLLPESGSVGVELTTVPPTEATAEAFLVLTEAGITYGVWVTAGKLEALYTDRFEDMVLASTTYDPVAHRWLRLSFEPSEDLIVWETARAVGDWELLTETELETGFDAQEAQIYFGAGVWSGPTTAEPLAAFGHAFVCGT